MKIEKEIVSKIPTDYLFVSGVIDLDPQYFKKRIDEGVKTSNLNYKTNVYGRHTDWEFFNRDKEFLVLLFQMLDHLETLTIDLQKFFLRNAWGLIEGLGEYTKKHHHEPNYISGAIYLNDHPQKLYFPDIKQEITPEIGRFALFSSFLSHHTKRNLTEKEKYAISFNFRNAVVEEK
jgi:hypothetical protein